MNFAQLLQVIGVSALVTLILALFVVRTRDVLRSWLSRRLSPRYLKPVGVRRRARQESKHD